CRAGPRYRWGSRPSVAPAAVGSGESQTGQPVLPTATGGRARVPSDLHNLGARYIIVQAAALFAEDEARIHQEKQDAYIGREADDGWHQISQQPCVDKPGTAVVLKHHNADLEPDLGNGLPAGAQKPDLDDKLREPAEQRQRSAKQ